MWDTANSTTYPEMRNIAYDVTSCFVAIEASHSATSSTLVFAFKIYIDFKEHSQRVSLTTDTWTSVQRINYMCVTAHYIDEQWKLNKKIISFVPIQSHKGDAIAKALEVCLVEWGIKNICSITVDNASSNDVAIWFLKSKLVSWGVHMAQYLHMRCIAHILNLVVQDGLKMANLSVKKLRENVRWVRGSPARLFKFKELATLLGVEDTCSLVLMFLLDGTPRT
ncbi:LOW QUALITY PROTEIN: hypothetical protein OSB04_un001774 [Centaurea solstitialis]|uniref:Uncharacterized protein n=1 Tax=Centaurea solstitialis TaxID=347529 RepID=A0AA38VQK8_9ASTR|nr:LOW QUALITY PROTEIN: hypothetical protein OSB04_un001774 [Centaurea solstitialis]